MCILSFAFLRAISSTFPWYTKKFFELIKIFNSSSLAEYSLWLIRWPFMSNSELFPFIVLLHGKHQLFHYIENSYTEIQIVKMSIYRIPSEFNFCKLVIFIFDFHDGSNCSGICHWLTNRSTMNQLTFQSFKRFKNSQSYENFRILQNFWNYPYSGDTNISTSFAKNKRNCIHKIWLSRSIWTNNRCEPTKWSNFNLALIGLEILDIKVLQKSHF